MGKHTIALAGGTLTRVGYVDVAIPPETAGLSASDLASVPWGEPIWSEGASLRAGAAAWFADLAGKRLVFDPVLAADAALRANRAVEAVQQQALADLFAGAGFPRDSVDLVVLSHIEGVGMVGWRDPQGSWSPFFPEATILISDVALHTFQRCAPDSEPELEREAWSALIEQGRVESFADGDVLVPGLSAAVSGGHCPGHTVLHFGADSHAPQVSMLGHLAISPLHLVKGECPAQHVDAASAWSILRAIVADGRTLIGPLWPSPGSGRWIGGVFQPND